MQLWYLIEAVFYLLSPFIHLFFLFLKLATVFQQGLIFLFVFEMLLRQGNFFSLDFLLQLVYLMVDDFISSLQLGDFVLGLG